MGTFPYLSSLCAGCFGGYFGNVKQATCFSSWEVLRDWGSTQKNGLTWWNWGIWHRNNGLSCQNTLLCDVFWSSCCFWFLPKLWLLKTEKKNSHRKGFRYNQISSDFKEKMLRINRAPWSENKSTKPLMEWPERGCVSASGCFRADFWRNWQLELQVQNF